MNARTRIAAALAATSITLATTAAVSYATEVPGLVVQNPQTTVKMSQVPNPPIASATATYSRSFTCKPMVGYSYTATTTVSVTTYNGLAYITRVAYQTSYPKGGYTDVTYAGKVGRVTSTSTGAVSTTYSGWVAPQGTRASVRQALSLPLATDPACSGTITVS